jgi:hypothetical protein
MRTPSYAGLSSFLYSVILTSALVPPAVTNVRMAAMGAPGVPAAVESALNGIRAQGFAGGAAELPPAAPTPAAMPAAFVTSKTGLTPELSAKIAAWRTAQGINREAPALIANSLGLSSAGQTWPDRQSAAQDTGDNSVHSIAVGRPEGDDILLGVIRGGILLAFRAHANGTMISALRFDTKTQALTVRTVAEAQGDLDMEYAFYSKNIDTIFPPTHSS